MSGVHAGFMSVREGRGGGTLKFGVNTKGVLKHAPSGSLGVCPLEYVRKIGALRLM